MKKSSMMCIITTLISGVVAAALISAILSLIRLIRAQNKRESFASKSLSGLLEDASNGKNPSTTQGELSAESARLDQIQTTDSGHTFSAASIAAYDAATANQEKEMREAEILYYGLAKHARSGELMQVRTTDGIAMGDSAGGFWVNAADPNKGVSAGLQYEDKFGADSGFSREYALWKCSKLSNCKGAVVARDGSRFGLFKSFSAPSIGETAKVQNAQAGYGNWKRGDTNSVTQARDVTGSPEYPLNRDYLAQDYDIWVRDSPERAALQAAEDNLRGAWSGKQGNKKLSAESEAEINCGAANSAVDWNDYACVISECVDRGKKITQSDGKKRWKSEWDCYARPKSQK